MINKLRNIYRTSRLRYFTQAAVIGGAIYTMIQLMPSGYELKEIDKFATVQQVTTEKGLFINDYRIPLELMKPDQEIELPYSQIKSPEGGLDLMVDDSGISVEVKEDKSSGLVEKIEPSQKTKEGKDGISIRGVLNSDYVLKIKSKGKEYEIRIKK
ncbi:MAG TPA: hypothetical protein VI564_07935 [Candidatus Nanoarchaeia archaeon]|nr:hypothetical protein [Candidatus Nanoarchaeia archaeon]